MTRACAAVTGGVGSRFFGGRPRFLLAGAIVACGGPSGIAGGGRRNGSTAGGT